MNIREDYSNALHHTEEMLRKTPTSFALLSSKALLLRYAREEEGANRRRVKKKGISERLKELRG